MGNPKLPGISVNGREDQGSLTLQLAQADRLNLPSTREDLGRLTLQLAQADRLTPPSPRDDRGRLTLPTAVLTGKGQDDQDRLTLPALRAFLTASTPSVGEKNCFNF